MAVPIYDYDDQIDSCSAGVKKSVELTPLTAKFVQHYIDTQQHQLNNQQLTALKAWRSQYLLKLKQQQLP